MNRVLCIFPANFRIGRNPALVSREAAQIEPIDECPLFDLLQSGIAFVGHLPMENFNSIEAPFGGMVDAGVDVTKLFTIKLPERIGRNAELSSPAS